MLLKSFKTSEGIRIDLFKRNEEYELQYFNVDGSILKTETYRDRSEADIMQLTENKAQNTRMLNG